MSWRIEQCSAVSSVHVVDETLESSIVGLCEVASDCMRAVVHRTECGLGSVPLDSPSEVHRALTAIELLLDRLARALPMLARTIVSHAESGVITIDDGTPYVHDVRRTATEVLRLLGEQAPPALDTAAYAVDGARALLANMSRPPASCA